MLKFANLLVTQDTIRDAGNLRRMVNHVRAGGDWTLASLTRFCQRNGGEPRMIYITRFPDGLEIIHDGHHRACSTWMAGRDHLRDGEYVLKDWSYESYMTPNFSKQFVTPFDPRIEVRLADFGHYKEQVLVVARKDEDAAMELIHANRDQYCAPRTIRTVQELAATAEHLTVAAE